jgi:hypothetical protein
VPASSSKPIAPATVRGFAAADGSDTAVENDQATQEETNPRPPAEQGTASDVHATLRATAQGATVVARLSEGGQQEKARLRDRIAALLSRYGLRTEGVRLNGAALPDTAQATLEEF